MAKAAANTRIIANEISVQPVGSESQAKAVASNLDEGIEKNYRAALISSGLDKQHVSFNAKNGLLILTGSVLVPVTGNVPRNWRQESPTYNKC